MFEFDELQVKGFNLFKARRFENIHYGSRQESQENNRFK